tara:strand:- start:6388 stop:8616 length:2229 start_codon:yes stop_codon:yes gene_type:complete
MKKLLLSLVLIFLFSCIIFFLGSFYKLFGSLEGPGVIQGGALPVEVIQDKADRINKVKGNLSVENSKQILFGDLHVHTTYSTDAFMWSLPFFNGAGASPIADACDFARFCSGLDFWSINDHAEASTPRKWMDTKESIRQCNDISEGSNDLVSFLGWEWTQVDNRPDKHYGHKNVIFLDTDDSLVPPRAIGSGGLTPLVMRLGLPWTMSALPAITDFSQRERYFAFDKFFEEIVDTPICSRGIPSKELPIDCYEEAEDPNILFSKLKEWGSPYMVIPHGTTWGYYTPAISDWRKQLESYQEDESQYLFEIYSGHGNSEEYRAWNDGIVNNSGELICPEPSDNFLPTCQQVGNIMAQRCEDSGLDFESCNKLVSDAKSNAVKMGSSGFGAIYETDPDEFLNAGQCQDCFLPSFNYRPLGSAQYVLAIQDFSDPNNPKRFKFGFIGSSDNHNARPGTGYKELYRASNTEARGFNNEFSDYLSDLRRPKGKLKTELLDVGNRQITSIADLNIVTDSERQSAYFMSGGLVAVHANSRAREDIWNALETKEAYATSGPRILLWFDAIQSNQEFHMGSELSTNASPVFKVKAAGSFKQNPGCPSHSDQALTKDRLEYICNSECYNPSDERRIIDRIEVVKILPQLFSEEPVEELILDVWRTFDCNNTTCEVEFSDDQFSTGKRDAIYYVRAIEEPSLTLSADPLGCEFDDEGNCITAKICREGFEKDRECIGPIEHRAWSSPIYLNYSL